MMRPAKISIEGDYWDCQIYRGRLYLWTFNGDLSVYDWDALIDSITTSENSILATTCAFVRGDYLYNPAFNLFFENHNIKKVLANQFEVLSKRKIVINKNKLKKHLISIQDVPTKELPIDTDVYHNKIISADQSGLYRYTIHKSSLKYAASTKSEKIWDCPLLSIKVGNRGNLAMSAGSEGLYEFMNFDYFDVDFYSNEHIGQISSKHSSFSNWAFSSIYSSSTVGASFLAPFFYNNDNETVSYNFFGRHNKSKPNFVSKSIIDDKTIFGETCGISWACNEKFYHYAKNKISIVNFTQSYLKEGIHSAFTHKIEIPLYEWKGDVISSGVAYFGTIIECENALIVLLSDGNTLTLPGSVVRWRVYPRSIRYENQLHIVKENSVEIYSFNNDYFVDQNNKKYGITYRTQDSRRQSISKTL